MQPIFLQNKTCLIVLLFAKALVYVSCSNSPTVSKAVLQPDKPLKAAARQKPASSFIDTIVIEANAAVFYSPDSLQFEKIKATTDSTVFESLEHETFFQERNAKIVLKRYYPQVKIRDEKNVRYLLFIKSDGSKNCIDLNTAGDASGLFVFDGRKNARQLDMTNIDTELGFYFTR